MRKVALFLGLLSLAWAAGALECSPAELSVKAEGPVLFSVRCEEGVVASGNLTLAPLVVFAGALSEHKTPPYAVSATYQIQGTPIWERAAGMPAAEGQLVQGTVTGEIAATAEIAAFFSGSLAWDGERGVLSIRSAPGEWQVYQRAALEGIVTYLGVSHTAVTAGEGSYRMNLGKLGRFGAEDVVVPVVLGLQEGLLLPDVGKTIAQSRTVLAQTLRKVDKKPQDVGVIWSLAALSKYLGKEDELMYAKRKMAAAHPNLVTQLEDQLQHIESFAVPTAIQVK